MRFVLKSKVHVHHERVRIRRIFDQLGARFRPQLDGFEGHEGNISNDFVEKWALLIKIKLNRHLSSDPQNGNSELFFSNGFTRTDQDFPSIVHRIEQHRHFRRPWAKPRRAFLDERRELIRRAFRPSHIVFRKRPIVPLQNSRRALVGWAA